MKAAAQSLLAGIDALPGAPEPVAAARRAGREGFERSGLPTTREEDWRFTSLAPLGALAFGHGDPAEPVTAAEIEGAAGPAAGPRLVFVNGRLRADLSSAHGLPDGVHAASLAHALATAPGLVAPRFMKEGSISTSFIFSRASPRKSTASSSSSPRALRCALSAVRRK